MSPSAETSDNKRLKISSTLSSLKTVTERYVWDEALRNGGAKVTNPTKESGLPALNSCPGTLNPEGATSDPALPVFDLSLLSIASEADRKKLVKEIGSAAEQWGFFQVINHGVPEAVLSDMEAYGMDFFNNLPMEVKERGVETDPGKHTYYHGYGGRFQHLKARVPWLEYLGESYHPDNGVEGMLEKISPGAVGNRTFCAATENYCKALVQLGRQLLEVLAESLGISPDFFSQHFTDSTDYQAHWRFNCYPDCPEPSKVLGLGPHTDPCAMTIVRQDGVGGFQLLNQGQWFDVKPKEGSLLINIGDCLQAWTNGKFQSVLHRALVNESSQRLSIVFPFSPPADLDISIPRSLIDESHPLKYEAPIEWHHLAVIKGNHVARESLTPKFALKLR